MVGTTIGWRRRQDADISGNPSLSSWCSCGNWQGWGHCVPSAPPGAGREACACVKEAWEEPWLSTRSGCKPTLATFMTEPRANYLTSLAPPTLSKGKSLSCLSSLSHRLVAIIQKGKEKPKINQPRRQEPGQWSHSYQVAKLRLEPKAWQNQGLEYPALALTTALQTVPFINPLPGSLSLSSPFLQTHNR